jgi:hypothetical protein
MACSSSSSLCFPIRAAAFKVLPLSRPIIYHCATLGFGDAVIWLRSDAGAAARDDSAPQRGAPVWEEDGRSFAGSTESGPVRTGSQHGGVPRIGAPLLMHRPVLRAPAGPGPFNAALGESPAGRDRPAARTSVPGSRAERILDERRAEVSRTDAAARLVEGRVRARAELERANAPYRVHCLYLVRSGPSAAQPLRILPGGPTYAARARMRVDADGLLLSPRLTSPRVRLERGPGVPPQRRPRAAPAPGDRPPAPPTRW